MTFDLAIPSGTCTPVTAEDRVSIIPSIPSVQRRKRTNTGPIRAHNPYGARGKLSCTNCRNRKWRCDYTSTDDPCTFCRERHLVCEKVWGAKRSLLMQNLAAIPQAEMDDGALVEVDVVGTVDGLALRSDAETYVPTPADEAPFDPVSSNPNSPTNLLVPDSINQNFVEILEADFRAHICTWIGMFSFHRFPEAPLTDPNLTPREVHYFEHLYYTVLPSPESIAGTIFRSLWPVYGITLSNSFNSDVLRSSVLASTVVSMALRMGQPVPENEYAYYKGRFFKGLIRALAEKTIDETHLFGLYFVLCNARSESGQEFDKHLDGFCRIMDYLNQQSKESGRQFPLQRIWRMMLSYHRRAYIYPTARALLIEKKDARLFAMHDLDLQLPSNLNLGGSVNRFVESSYYSGEPRCRRLSRGWDVMDILSSLKAKFRTLYHCCQSELRSLETNLLFGKFLQTIREGNEGFERFRYLHKAFEQTNEPGFEEASRIEELFIASYIHLHAVLSLMEFIVQRKTARLPDKVLQVLSSKKPATNPEDDATFLVPTLFCLSLAREISGYPKRALQDLSSLKCDKCAAFAEVQRDRPQCPHPVAAELTGDLETLESEPLERKDYIKLVLENDWIWGLGIGVCRVATASFPSLVCDVLNGLQLERPTRRGASDGN